MEKSYFVVNCTYDDIGKVYLNRGGVWGEFSIFDTVMGTTVEALNYHYFKYNGCNIAQDVESNVEKVTINLTFKDVFK